VDINIFIKQIKDWEWHWVNERKDYKLRATGDAIELAKEMYNKYNAIICDAYR